MSTIGYDEYSKLIDCQHKKVKETEMTNEEQKILDFIKAEPTLTDDEYDNQVKEIAKSLKIRKGDVEDLVNLTDTSYYNSKEFEKALVQYQNLAPDFIKNS